MTTWSRLDMPHTVPPVAQEAHRAWQQAISAHRQAGREVTKTAGEADQAQRRDAAAEADAAEAGKAMPKPTAPDARRRLDDAERRHKALAAPVETTGRALHQALYEAAADGEAQACQERAEAAAAEADRLEADAHQARVQATLAKADAAYFHALRKPDA